MYLLCGFSLINHEKHPLYKLVFFRENMRCGVPIRPHYYNELVKKYVHAHPLICPFCGSSDVESNPPIIDGYKTRAMCKSCIEMLDKYEADGGKERIKYGKSRKRENRATENDED